MVRGAASCPLDHRGIRAQIGVRPIVQSAAADLHSLRSRHKSLVSDCAQSCLARLVPYQPYDVSCGFLNMLIVKSNLY